MLVLFESALMHALAVGPELFLLVGVPELPARRRFLTLRRGDRAAVVEV